MKILHTPIVTEKAGFHYIAKCEYIPEKWKKCKPIAVVHFECTPELAKEKLINFLSDDGQDELEEVEAFEIRETQLKQITD